MNTGTRLWLGRHHPATFEADGKVCNRCPTCDEPSPCKVRQVFHRFDLLVKANDTLAPEWFENPKPQEDAP